MKWKVGSPRPQRSRNRVRHPRASRFRDKFVNTGCGSDYVGGMVNVAGNILRRKEIRLDVVGMSG